MTLPPTRVGYAGQKYRIVVDDTDTEGKAYALRIGWSNKQDPAMLAVLNDRPGWHNARYEEVTDPEQERQTWHMK